MFVYAIILVGITISGYKALEDLLYSNHKYLQCDVSLGALIFSGFCSSCVPCPHIFVCHILFAVMFVFVTLPNTMDTFGPLDLVFQKMKFVTHVSF